MHRIALTSLALLATALIAVPASAEGETCDGRAATIVVTIDADQPYRTRPVTGTPGDDVIVGTDLADTIDGAGGNDVICGLRSQDDLTGGEGDDRLFGGLDGSGVLTPSAPWSDMLKPGPGDDFVDLGLDPNAQPVMYDKVAIAIPTDRISYEDSASGVDVDLTPVDGLGRAIGEGTDTIVVAGRMSVVGSAQDDRITGSPYDDSIWSGRGSDVVSGADGDDELFPDAGIFDHVLADSEDRDHVSPDMVEGGAGHDTIWSPSGQIVIDAGEGDDDVDVDRWQVHGAADGSRISGGAGDDSIVAQLVRGLQVRGGSGDDQITHSVFDQPGAVTTLGGAGDDHLTLVTWDAGIAADDRVTVDRQRSRLRINSTVGRMSGYERYWLRGPGNHWLYRGTDGRDRVTARGAKSLTAHTFAGRDRVEGTDGRDHLDLGRGRDRAGGRVGRDTCLNAERATGCEVRR